MFSLEKVTELPAFTVLSEYAKHVFGVLSEYVK